MKLNENDLKKIKAFYVISKVPVCVFDEDFTLLKNYRTNQYKSPPYKKTFQWDSLSCHLKFDYGIFHEIFISILYKGNTIMIGPILTHKQQKSYYNYAINKMCSEEEKTLTSKSVYWEYYMSISLYSLGDIRDFVIMLGSLFEIDLEDIYSHVLHKQVYDNQLKLKEENLDTNKRHHIFEAEKYSFYYENKILELVSKGDLDLLRSGIAKLGCSVVPTPSSSSLRSEKNYTIVIAEKLCSLAIQAGKDVTESMRLRDFYMDQVEKQKTLVHVLQVRDSAIIHFTKELHRYSLKKHSPAIASALQYIHLHIYTSIKIKDLAQHVFMSESALRHNFKKEMGINITEYILQRKISEAKLALKQGMSISAVSLRMGFYDSSHFYKTFKKYTGVSPAHYQQNTHSF